MMNKFKIKPIRVRGWARQLYSSLLGAHTCWPNEPQILPSTPSSSNHWSSWTSKNKSCSQVSLKTLPIPPHEINFRSSTRRKESGHHEQYHHGHLQQLSLCQIPLQTQPTWPRRELLQHHQENSYITRHDLQPACDCSKDKQVYPATDWQMGTTWRWTR